MRTPKISPAVSRKRGRVFFGLWLLCFVLLFFFYFVKDFYVTVGSGPGSWKKLTPLSLPERAVLSLVLATLLSGYLVTLYACLLFFRRLIRQNRHRKSQAHH